MGEASFGVRDGIEGVRKSCVPAESISGRFAAVGPPLQTSVEAVSLPDWIGEDPIPWYGPITGDEFKAGAVALIADPIAATDTRRFGTTNVRIRGEIAGAGEAPALAKIVGCWLAAFGAPIETPVKALVKPPRLAVCLFVLRNSMGRNH